MVAAQAPFNISSLCCMRVLSAANPNCCRHEGVRGLYHGLSSPLCGVAMENGVSFLVFSRVMDYFRPEVAPHSGGQEPETPLHAVPSESQQSQQQQQQQVPGAGKSAAAVAAVAVGAAVGRNRQFCNASWTTSGRRWSHTVAARSLRRRCTQY
jgi:hypothetical protein